MKRKVEYEDELARILDPDGLPVSKAYRPDVDKAIASVACPECGVLEHESCLSRKSNVQRYHKSRVIRALEKAKEA